MTTAGSSRYKYPLRALETLYAHRLEQARLLLAAAQRALEAHQLHVDELQLALRRCHGAWTGASGRAERFYPALYAAAREALASRQAALNVAMEARRTLSADVERRREDVSQALRRTEVLQRHKENAMREYALETVRIDQRQADAAWSPRGLRP